MRLPSRPATFVGALALLGLALAVGLAVLASRLTTQHIGVAAGSPDIGTHLVAPAPVATPTKRHPTHHTTHTTPVRTATVTVVVPATPVSPPPVVITPSAPVITPAPAAPSHSGDDSSSHADD
jgi:hypothetical protein